MAIKVLIVEDDIEMNRLLRIDLDRHGYDVSTATNGLDGLRLFHEVRPDRIIRVGRASGPGDDLAGGRQEMVSIEEFCGKIEAAIAARRDPNVAVVAVSDLERTETRRYLEMFYGLQFRPLAAALRR